MKDYADKTIKKKQYLGRNDISEFVVPDGVTEIQDWAFAQCAKLRVVKFPASLQKVGKNIFLDCPNLKDVLVESIPVEMSRVLAYAFSTFDFISSYNFELFEIKEWFEMFDNSLHSYLRTLDDMDFSPFLAGGEEDYQDINEARQEYKTARKEKKCYMVMERMLLETFYPITNTYRNDYCNYLVDEIDIAIQVLLLESEKQVQFYQLLKDLKIINDKERDRILPMLDERHVELKALILSEQSNSSFVWNHFQL